METSLPVIKRYFVESLLAWFKVNQRDLPWRRTKDPYHIWVSEIMLQQTQVNTVIPYYERFMARFPTIEALAAAEEEEVLKYWEGLGYYSRARNLLSAVREVNEVYDAAVPKDAEQIRKLKGVGPYTAGAILSIAFNQPEPAVDGNVMRVLARYFYIDDDISKNKTRLRMEQLVREIIPPAHAGDFNEALMELGALVCTPRSPQCAVCPVAQHCAARQEEEQHVLPLKAKAKPPRREQRVVALVEGSGPYAGRILVRQRAADGLLARLWELPHCELVDEEGQGDHDIQKTDVENVVRLLSNEIGHSLVDAQYMMDITHVFSHIRWEMKVFLCQLDENALNPDGPLDADGLLDPNGEVELAAENYRWMTLEQREQYPFPNVFVRILDHYEQSSWVYVED